MDKNLTTLIKRVGFVGFLFFLLKGLAWIAVLYFGVKFF